MDYGIVLTDQFEKTSDKITKWLQKEWSVKSAHDFKEKLWTTIQKVTENPFIGRKSRRFEDVRSVLVTKHNRLYYHVEDSTITFLDLVELKQSPHRNKYE